MKWNVGKPTSYPCVVFIESLKIYNGILFLRKEIDFKDLEIETVQWVPVPKELTDRLKKKPVDGVEESNIGNL